MPEELTEELLSRSNATELREHVRRLSKDGTALLALLGEGVALVEEIQVAEELNGPVHDWMARARDVVGEPRKPADSEVKPVPTGEGESKRAHPKGR